MSSIRTSLPTKISKRGEYVAIRSAINIYLIHRRGSMSTFMLWLETINIALNLLADLSHYRMILIPKLEHLK